MKICPKCQHADKIRLVEYFYMHPEHYDGVSEYECLHCGYRQGRWTEKELPEGYIEPRFGRGGEPIPLEEGIVFDDVVPPF